MDDKTVSQIAFTNRLVYSTPSMMSDNLLNEMIEYCDKLQYMDAEVNGTHGVRTNLDVRRTDVAFIPWDEWIPGILNNIMMSANEEYFNYDLTYFESRIQCGVYKGEDQGKYDWHVDASAPFWYHGKLHERKLSCSFMLSGPDEYTGGEMQFCLPSVKKAESKKPEKGSALIFPSWLPHRVKPVKSGIRKSLVVWMHGPMFK